MLGSDYRDEAANNLTLIVNLGDSLGVLALLDVGVIFEGPKVGRSKTYRLNEQFGWKGTVSNHKKALKNG
ncbi:hypothetical protein ACSLOD_27975, partial [Escherichia coli]